jgi:DivIVA domain-containing protein
MPLTPADVARVVFSKPPIGKRGYHEDEVDAFLDLLEAELARLIEENNDLRNQVEQLDQQQRAAPVDTRTQAEIMLTDARTRAETVGWQSREKAASLERDAARRHTEMVSAFSQEKSALENKIEKLRAWEREYRTRLRSYLAAQLRERDGSRSGAPGGPMRNRQGFVASGSGAHAEAGSR